MKLDYGKSITKALSFGFAPKRWFPLFILHSVFAVMLISLLFVSIPLLNQILIEDPSNLFIMDLFMTFVPILLGVIAWWFISIWILGAIIHQSNKENEFDQSWKVSLNRYLYLLTAILLITIISAGAGAIPIIGGVISIILGIVFFFVMQGVVVSKLGPVDSLNDSYKIFTKNPVDVFLVWFITSLISVMIAGLFALPGLIILAHIFMPVFQLNVSDPTIYISVIESLKVNIPILIVTGAIFIAGVSVSQTFALKLQTEFYKQFRSKKYGLF